MGEKSITSKEALGKLLEGNKRFVASNLDKDLIKKKDEKKERQINNR